MLSLNKRKIFRCKMVQCCGNRFFFLRHFSNILFNSCIQKNIINYIYLKRNLFRRNTTKSNMYVIQVQRYRIKHKLYYKKTNISWQIASVSNYKLMYSPIYNIL